MPSTNDGLSSFTTATAYVQGVKFIDPEPKPGSKKPRKGFYVVRLAVHNGKKPDGGLAYLYPECGITDELTDYVRELHELQAGRKDLGDERIVARVEIANLRGAPWSEGSKSGVNYRGTLRSVTPIEEDGAQ